MNRKLIIWGAGRIGRGFVADIFDEPGWDTAFVDIDPALVKALNQSGEYTIARATKDGISKRKLKNGFTALHTSDEKALKALFLAPELLLDIAVHAPKLPEVADMLAPLFAWRAENAPMLPMDVMMNVNMAKPDEAFVALMREKLSGRARAYFDDCVGVTGIFAMCISPIAPEALLREDPLALWNNGYPEQAIGANALKCPPPRLRRLRLTHDVSREETRKLYTLNMAHALVCYLGLPMGLKTAREAALSEALRPILLGALAESAHGLIGEYGFVKDEMREWSEIIVALLENPYIEDNLQRLGADTRRKLGAWDRLVGPARLCMKYGREPKNLCSAIRAGFFYDNDDEGTKSVRERVQSQGLRAALDQYCNLAADHPLTRLILGETIHDAQ